MSQFSANAKRSLIALVIIFSACAAGCQRGDESRHEQEFGHAGSFRDDRGNRLYTIEIRGEPDADAALDNARTYPYTPGQVLAVYYYPRDATIPRDGVTLAKTFPTASNVVHEGRGLDPWRFVYMRGFDGHETFVDCLNTPSHDLCPTG